MDVEAYLDRIGYRGPQEVSSGSLRELHAAHTFAVPFENLDIHLGRAISLDPASLFDKIVNRRRGGYCFELNGLFALLLERLGFSVRQLMARVLWGQAGIGPLSHRVLLIETGGERWIADVGFGGNGLIAAIPLASGHEEQQHADRFRVMSDQEGVDRREERAEYQGQHRQGYRIDCLVKDTWEPMYSFTTESYLPVDYTYANYYHSHSPESLFTQKRLCTRPTPNGRIILQNRALKIRHGGHGQTEAAKTLAVYRSMLTDHFGIALSEADLRTCFVAEHGDMGG
jgi:N-hydroxyarylamine O-acetyltransferase